MKPIKHIKIEKDMKVSELVSGMGEMGHGARHVNEASEILREMVEDDDCKLFFGLAGAMVPAGMKEIIIDMLDEEVIDVFVSTGANLTHDLIESLGHHHYKGHDVVDDKKLHDEGVDRIYNTYMKNEVYEDLEKFFQENWNEISVCKDVKELLWKLGELVDGKGILGTCWKKKIPIFCPAISDSGIGLMIWGRLAGGAKIDVNAFEDMKEIIDIAWTSKKNGIFYVGGGTPKNYIQQSMQFSKGAEYGIQLTTDRPESGGSSGAPLKEGISWGKMEGEAKFVDVICDATISLPLIWGAFKE